MIQDLLGDFDAVTSALPKGDAAHSIIKSVADAIRRNQSFLEFHPDLLLQTLWNSFDQRSIKPPTSLISSAPQDTIRSNRPIPFCDTALADLLYRWLIERSSQFSTDSALCLVDSDSRSRSFLKLVLTASMGEVHSLAPSPDGRHVASGTQDGVIRLWDLSCGSIVQTIAGHDGAVLALAFSPNGEILASGGEDGRIRLWTPEGGTLLSDLSGHFDDLFHCPARVMSLAFSRDGKRLVSTGDNECAMIWDPDAGDLLERKQHTKEVGEILAGEYDLYRAERSVPFAGFLPGNMLLSVGDDGYLKVWRGTEVISLRIWLSPMRDIRVSLSPNDEWIALSNGHDLVILRTSLLESILEKPVSENVLGVPRSWMDLTLDDLPHQKRYVGSGAVGTITSVGFSDNVKMLITGSSDHSLGIWSVDSLEFIESFPGFVGRVNCIVPGIEKEGFLVGGADQAISVWNSGSGDPSLLLTPTVHSANITVFSFSRCQRFLLSGDKTGAVAIWDTSSRDIVCKATSGHGRVLCGSPIPSHGLFFTGHQDGIALSANMANGEYVGKFSDGKAPLECLFVPEESDVLLTGSRDGVLRLWSVDSPVVRRRMIGHTAAITSVSANLAGTIAVTGAEDGSLLLWDLISGDSIASFQSQGAWIKEVAFSADEKSIVSVSGENNCRSWDVKTGRCTGTATLPARYLSFSRSRKSIAVAADIEGQCTEILEWPGDNRFTYLPGIPTIAKVSDTGAIIAIGHGKQVRVYGAFTGAVRPRPLGDFEA